MYVLRCIILPAMILTAVALEDCKNVDDPVGMNYTGKINKTLQGLTCQAWALDAPHDNDNNHLPENFCRNPSLSYPGPWCYTMDPKVRFDICPVYTCGKYCNEGFFQCNDGSCILDYWRCNHINECPGGEDEQNCHLVPECLEDPKGYTYRGKQNITEKGKVCQNWSAALTLPNYGYNRVFNAENYCRNMESEKPWCYTTDPNDKWNFCDIPICPHLTTQSRNTGNALPIAESDIKTPDSTIGDKEFTKSTENRTTPNTEQTSDKTTFGKTSPPSTVELNKKISHPTPFTTNGATKSSLNTVSFLSTPYQSDESISTECPCTCQSPPVLNTTITVQDLRNKLRNKLQQLERILRVNKYETSAFIRSKISMSDDRVSSQSIGGMGVTVLICIVVIIFLLDLTPRK